MPKPAVGRDEQTDPLRGHRREPHHVEIRRRNGRRTDLPGDIDPAGAVVDLDRIPERPSVRVVGFQLKDARARSVRRRRLASSALHFLRNAIHV